MIITQMLSSRFKFAVMKVGDDQNPPQRHDVELDHTDHIGHPKTDGRNRCQRIAKIGRQGDFEECKVRVPCH